MGIPQSFGLPDLPAQYNPPNVGPSAQQQIEDMKKFMSKDVTELAAGIKEPFAYDLVLVRGRRMVIPKQTQSNTINSTVFSCLYALEDPRIDKILAAVNVTSHFMMQDGTVVRQPLIMADVPEPYVPAPKEVFVNQKALDQPRNILIEEAPKPFGQQPGQMVAVFDPKGTLVTVGAVWVWNTKQSPVCHIVKTFAGKELEVAEELLQKIDSMAEFVDFCSKVRQQ